MPESRTIATCCFLAAEILIFISCLIIIDNYYSRPYIDIEEKILSGSIILTLKEIMKKNNYETYPILDIDSNNKITLYNQNYVTLLKNSHEPCKQNYKKCGVLDTLGNIMCIPQTDECPINEVIIDSYSEYDNYTSKGYKVAFLENLTEYYALYYTNKETEKNIVVKLDFFDSKPEYITEENLIYDKDAFKRYKGDKEESSSESKPQSSSSSSSNSDKGSNDNNYRDDDDFSWGDIPGDYFDRVLDNDPDNDYDYRTRTLDQDIKKWFKYYDDNTDKSFKYVSRNLYIGNFIGFKNVLSMKKYTYIDFHYLYFAPFPDGIAIAFCFLGAFIIYLTIIYLSIKVRCKEKIFFISSKIRPLYIKLITEIPYLMFTLGYFIYIIYSFHNLYVINELDNVSKIKAEYIIEYIIEEVEGRHNAKSWHVIDILLFTFSLVLYIVSEVFEYVLPADFCTKEKIPRYCSDCFNKVIKSCNK